MLETQTEHLNVKNNKQNNTYKKEEFKTSNGKTLKKSQYSTFSDEWINCKKSSYPLYSFILMK